MAKPPEAIWGVLPHQAIRHWFNQGIIQNGDAKSIRTASYDLRMGDEYYIRQAGSSTQENFVHKAEKLNIGETVEVPKGRVLLLKTTEKVSLPADFVGHLSLKFELLHKGMFMASQSQIDAGYSGIIFAMLYNLSEAPVQIKRDSPVLRLELVRLEEASIETYKGDVSKAAGLQDLLHSPPVGALFDVAETVRKTEERIRGIEGKLNLFQFLVPVVGAAIGLVATSHFASVSDVNPLKERLGGLENRVGRPDTTVEEMILALEQLIGTRATSGSLTARVSFLAGLFGLSSLSGSIDVERTVRELNERSQSLESRLVSLRAAFRLRSVQPGLAEELSWMESAVQGGTPVAGVSLDKRVDTIGRLMDGLLRRVSELDGQGRASCEGLEGRIEALESRVRSNASPGTSWPARVTALESSPALQKHSP